MIFFKDLVLLGLIFMSKAFNIFLRTYVCIVLLKTSQFSVLNSFRTMSNCNCNLLDTLKGENRKLSLKMYIINLHYAAV